MDGCGAMVEWYWQGKTEVLGEKHYTAWVVDGWMSVEQWWNGTDREKLKCWEKNPSHWLHSWQTVHDLAWYRMKAPMVVLSVTLDAVRIWSLMYQLCSISKFPQASKKLNVKCSSFFALIPEQSYAFVPCWYIAQKWEIGNSYTWVVVNTESLFLLQQNFYKVI